MASAARTLGGIVVGVGAALAAAASCTIFNGLRATTTPATDAAPEAEGTGDDAVAACDSAAPPPPPAQSSPGNESVSFVAAMRTLTGIEPGDAGLVLGFDLDGVCTCPGPPSCRSLASPPAQNCDEPGGRDLQGKRAPHDLR
jgi:hypothetical protein